MRWYCQVYRFQIMEKHIDSIKWKNALVLSTPILLLCMGLRLCILAGTDGWWDLISMRFLVHVAADTFLCNWLSIKVNIL